MLKNVRITIVDLDTKLTQYVERNNITEDESGKLWEKYCTDIRGASTSNLGYENKDCPKYNILSGCLNNTNVVTTFIQWDSNDNNIN